MSTLAVVIFNSTPSKRDDCNTMLSSTISIRETVSSTNSPVAINVSIAPCKSDCASIKPVEVNSISSAKS